MSGSPSFAHVRFISAGAGSGKTYRLTQELERALLEDTVDPAGVIGTTFTVKAAAELRERVRERLIRNGRIALAEQTAEALLGTVHSVCERLLQRYAFELGLSPELHVASIEDGIGFFNQALDEALSAAPELPRDAVRSMNDIAQRLGIVNWRADVKQIAQSHLSRIEAKIAELQSLRRTLSHLVHCCEGNARPDCPILDDLAGDHDGTAA